MTRRTTGLVLVAGVLFLSLQARHASGCTVEPAASRVPSAGVRVDVGDASFTLRTWVTDVVDVGLELPFPTALPRGALRLTVAIGGGDPLLELRVGAGPRHAPEGGRTPGVSAGRGP